MWYLVSKYLYANLDMTEDTNPILANLMKEPKNLMNKQLILYADIVDYKPPTITNGLSQ